MPKAAWRLRLRFYQERKFSKRPSADLFSRHSNEGSGTVFQAVLQFKVRFFGALHVKVGQTGIAVSNFTLR